MADGLDVAVAQSGEGEGGVVIGDENGLGVFFAQIDLIDRALVDADAQAIQLLRRGQGSLFGDELLARGEIGDGEIDLGGALGRDGEIGQDQINLARG